MSNQRNLITLVIIIAVILFVFFAKPFRPSTQSSSGVSTSATDIQSAVENDAQLYQPVVVSIVATKDLPVIKQCTIQPINPGFENPSLNNGAIIRNCIIQNQQVPISGGTGFAIDSRGVILTNKHVVEDTSADYTVLVNDGSQEHVTQIYRDPKTDVALVKINRNLVQVAKLGDSNTIKTGQFVVAIGNALGELHNSVSFGIISGLGRTIVASDQTGQNSEELENVIQTDTPINPGNSGGPLIDLSGKVIAMNTAKAQAENIGFAIPINDIKPIIMQFTK